jgi:hypothetical protein
MEKREESLTGMLALETSKMGAALSSIMIISSGKQIDLSHN